MVVAGGSGSRFGRPKQFLDLAGQPVITWSVQAARSVAHGVVVVVPAGFAGDTWGADLVVEGGGTRSASVRAGLAAVPADASVIVVHDAARPLAGAVLFQAVVDAISAPGTDGVIPVLPVSDTLKRVSGDVVTDTLDRQGVVTVQTPQAFVASTLRAAHASGDEATDDAGLLEARGATVRTVPGSPTNLKLTYPEDLALASALVEVASALASASASASAEDQLSPDQLAR